MKKQSLLDQLVIKHLFTDYGIEADTLTPLLLGADIDAAVYKVQTQNIGSYFVKLKRGCGSASSVGVVEFIHTAGILQVIPPVKTIHGRLVQQVGDFTISVYPFIEALDGFCRDLTDAQWRILGKALRQLHEITVPLSMQKQIRHEVFSPKWRDAVRSLFIYIEAKPSSDEIALKLLKFMQENMPAIHRLVDRAESLGQIVQNQRHKAVLCHSDIHGGNVLIGENDTIYIVDWDDPIMAPKERDLMFIGGGVANVWNKAREEVLFYEGYGKADVNATLMAYYRHERIVEDIAVYGNALLLTTAGGDGRLEMYKQFVDMFEPRGVVDIAFETDEK